MYVDLHAEALHTDRVIDHIKWPYNFDTPQLFPEPPTIEFASTDK